MCSCLKCTEAYRNYVKDLTVYSELLHKSNLCSKGRLYDLHQYIFVSLGVLDGTVNENDLEKAHFDLIKDIRKLKDSKQDDREVKEGKLRELADELGVRIGG